jgi:hypothetical protein
MFRVLCGSDYSPRIALVTTHWTEEGTRQHHGNVRRHERFRQSWMGNPHEKGANIFGLWDETPYHSEPILDHVLGIHGEDDYFLMDEQAEKNRKKLARRSTNGNVLGRFRHNVLRL